MRKMSYTLAAADDGVRVAVIEDSVAVHGEQRQVIGKSARCRARHNDLSTLAKAQDFPVRTIPDGPTWQK